MKIINNNEAKNLISSGTAFKYTGKTFKSSKSCIVKVEDNNYLFSPEEIGGNMWYQIMRLSKHVLTS